MDKNTLSKIISVLLIFEIFLMWPFFFHTIFSDILGGIDDVEGLLLIILLILYFIVYTIHEYFIPEILFALCFFAGLIVLIQTINFQNETDKFKGLETLVNKNFFSLFTSYKEERTILIAKNRLFRTHQMNENISGISAIPDALLISFDKKNKLQISLVEYECYGDGKTRSTEKSKYLNSHIIPQLMQFASSFSIITDKSIRDTTIKDWIAKIIDYTSENNELSDKIDSWVQEMNPNISTRAIISFFEKKLLEAFESNVHVFLIIDELSYDQKETIKNIITSFKVECGNPVIFDASVVKLVQKISFVNQEFEYALTAQ